MTGMLGVAPAATATTHPPPPPTTTTTTTTTTTNIYAKGMSHFNLKLLK